MLPPGESKIKTATDLAASAVPADAFGYMIDKNNMTDVAACSKTTTSFDHAMTPVTCRFLQRREKQIKHYSTAHDCKLRL